MEHLLSNNYSESIAIFDTHIEEAISSNAYASLAVLYCNRATAELGLELYRRCIKSTEKALAVDAGCLRAYILQGKAYISIGKEMNARSVWQKGIDHCDVFCDAAMVLELHQCLALLEKTNYGAGNSSSENDFNTIRSSDLKSLASCTPPPPPSRLSHSSSTSSSPSPQQQPQARALYTSPASSTASSTTSPTIRSKTTPTPTLSLAHLGILRDHFIGEEGKDGDGKIHPSYIASAKQALSHASGESVVDDLIAVGYLLVNSNNLSAACELFTTLLHYKSDLFAAHLALGSAYALQGEYDEAISSFTKAIAIDPTEADAWKRRAQTRAAKGLTQDALTDYNRSLELGSDADTYYQRGVLYHQMKDYRRALMDIKRHNDMGSPPSAQLWNYIGMCESQLGNLSGAIESFKNTIEMDETFAEARINCAQIYKEAGEWKLADEMFEEATRKGSRIVQVHYFRALLHYGLGNSLRALGYMRRFLGETDKLTTAECAASGIGEHEIVHSLVISALCLQTMGALPDALEYFNKALARDPTNICRVQKHIMLYYYAHLDASPRSFNIDRDLNPILKEMWCKSLPSSKYALPDSALELSGIHSIDAPFEPHEETKALLEISSHFSSWVQLQTPGFLPHKRQQRAFGLAAINMAKILCQHVDSLIATGKPMTVPTAGASGHSLNVTNSVNDATSSQDIPIGYHTFGYRDFFDIAVRWRQISEPNDAVWWIDRLPKQSFEEGFGLHTPIINGQLKCIRYYPYFSMGFNLLKNLASKHFFSACGTERELSDEKKRCILSCTTLEEVYSIIGEDFYVVCPCRSSIDDTIILEGTRLTLMEKSPNGFDFSIRSPGLPSRWEAMDREISACFNRMVEVLVHLRSVSSTCHTDALKRETLKLFFYWANFAPLTRGSAQCGYAALLACILASGNSISSPIAPGKQYDWEAIFTEDPDEFINKVSEWVQISPSVFPIEEIDFDCAMPSLKCMLHSLIFDICDS